MQIILVHTITKFYHSNPSCCREMQGDAKLHPPGMGCSETPRNRVKAWVEWKNIFIWIHQNWWQIRLTNRLTSLKYWYCYTFYALLYTLASPFSVYASCMAHKSNFLKLLQRDSSKKLTEIFQYSFKIAVTIVISQSFQKILLYQVSFIPAFMNLHSLP